MAKSKKSPVKRFNVKKQRISIDFAQYRITGWFGNFTLVKVDGHTTWNEKKEEYVWHERCEMVEIDKAYCSSLYCCLKYIQDNLWHDLKISEEEDDEENVVDTFLELLIVAERIDKRMEKLSQKIVLRLTDTEKLVYPDQVRIEAGVIGEAG